MTPWIRSQTTAVPTNPAAQEPAPGEFTVGEVASLVGISVRTLHHWDSVGLVHPRGRTTGGYRTYSAEDVGRIHRVLVYRELGFALTQIALLLDDPTVDEAAQLRQQRHLLEERIARLQQMAAAVDQILESRTSGTSLTAQQQAEIFGRGWREDWAEEAQDRWGESEEWAQFERKAVMSSETERIQLQLGGDALFAELAAAKRSGIAAGSDEANRLAERHRETISALFNCSHSMQVCLGQLYVQDARFTAQIDEREPGLSVWLSEIIDANARLHSVDPATATWE
ncbi:MerR family transcriptional regulator [Leucobacter insecticola]|uniref:MerR family transcriptional regulator n=2 Tax=Leucobacter insecticola TaxID=2714934 RepID=A0A6G8FM17_9MICO|nr:MerR family transcriptional regulator [Leucobacter insecticola]